MHGLSLVAASGGYSNCSAQASPWGCATWALERRLQQLQCLVASRHVEYSQIRDGTRAPALAGEFPTTGPPCV